MKCPKCAEEMYVKHNPGSCSIDVCPKCKGIWLDTNELQYFVNNHFKLLKYLGGDLYFAKECDVTCPRCKYKMMQGGFISENLVIERCKICRGMWLDEGELETVRGLIDGTTAEKTTTILKSLPAAPGKLLPLPNLALRSGMVIFSLYGILFLFLLALTQITQLKARVGQT